MTVFRSAGISRRLAGSWLIKPTLAGKSSRVEREEVKVGHAIFWKLG